MARPRSTPRGTKGLAFAGALAAAALQLAPVPARAAGLAAPPAPASALVPYRQGRLWGFADRTGRLVLPPAYERASVFSEGLARVEQGGKWGFVDATGRAVVPLRFDSLGFFAEGLAPACADTALSSGVTEGVGRHQRDVKIQACGFVDRAGHEVVPLRYTGVNGFAAGVAQVRIGRPSPCQVATEWGLVDAGGHEVLPVAYCYVSPASEGLVKVIYEEPTFEVRRFGFHTLDGKVALPKLPYDGSHEAWSEGVIGVRQAGRFGFIDHAGRETVPLRFESTYPYSEGLAAARLDGKWGFIDHAGRTVVPFRYDEVDSFEGGSAWARQGNLAGFIDRTGATLVPFAFDGWIDRQGRPGWSQGLCGMKAVDGGWGFIDRRGRWVVPPDYDWVRPCSEGLCAVQSGKLWGFVDLAGKLVVPARYLRLESTFADGLAYVSRRLRPDLPHFAEGFIDPSGREFFDEPPLF